MKELSLYILDLVQNSIRAEAKCISISVKENVLEDFVEIIIGDNGCGMDSELLAKVTEPFTTTRTTRKTGMGIPFFKMAAEMTGGTFYIDSVLGKGTTLRGVFGRSHLDTPPMGDIVETLVTLVQGAPDVDFFYCYETDGTKTLTFDTQEIRGILEGVPKDVPLNTPDLLYWIRDHLTELSMSIENN
jgi:hypothetical protein